MLIVGAGISGIGAAYHLQTHLPEMRYAIVEARERMGGTWDLFRYPGIRSDSDMYTLGYRFRPWTGKKSIADGASILAYLEDTAREFGIDDKIRYDHAVESASFDSDAARWTVTIRRGEETVTLSPRYLFMCGGYYDYAEGYTPDFEGVERFGGQVVHPQHWPQDLDYAGKRVVVIGSGATAVTLVPELAKDAAHVTMLQRSPSYIVSVPGQDPINSALKKRLPAPVAYRLTRWKNIVMGTALYNASRRLPEQMRKLFLSGVRRQLGEDYDVETHFSPSYAPWDQRLCLVPDADLFRAIREGRASVVTDHIERFTEGGLELRSGETLEADIIVTATGLKLAFMGNIALTVDGAPIESSELYTYKGMMFSGLPNLALWFGYTNASWTLRADLTSAYVCRLLAHMEKHGFRRFVPRVGPDVEERPFMALSSGYVARAQGQLPKQGSRAPWRTFDNYMLDRVKVGRSRVDEAMELS